MLWRDPSAGEMFMINPADRKLMVGPITGKREGVEPPVRDFVLAVESKCGGTHSRWYAQKNTPGSPGRG